MPKETEVKFRVDSKEEIVSRLEKIGFSRGDEYRERNLVVDKGGTLKDSDKLLRFRRIENTKTEEVFTYKGPREGSLKTREEIEFETDIRKLLKIFSRLGYEAQFKYEKIREVWKRGDLEVMIDDLPFLGLFVEIEGEEKDIEELAKSFQFSMNESITETYLELFAEYKSKNDIDRENLVWEDFEL